MVSGALSSRASAGARPLPGGAGGFKPAHGDVRETPRSSFDLVFHFRDLEQLGLVDAALGRRPDSPERQAGALYARDGQLVQGRCARLPVST